MARPKSDKYVNVVENVIKYTEETEYPILKEFCYKYNYNYETMMNLERKDEVLKQCIKRLVNKKESYLEREGVKGTINTTMAVFTLKQLGWRDKLPEPEDTSQLAKVKELIDKIDTEATK